MTLSEHYKTEFDRFIALIAKWQCTYKSALCQYLSIKGDDGNCLLSGRIVFEPTFQSVNQTPLLSFETAHILAQQHYFRIEKDEIIQILDDAKEGRIKIKKLNIPLTVKKDNYLSVYFALVDRSNGFRLPSLRINGDRKYEVLAKIDRDMLDWELKAADKPFNDIDELLMHFGLPPFDKMGDSASFEIVAKAPGLITNTSRLREDHAIIDCMLGNDLDKKCLKIGYRLFKRNEIERGKIQGDSFSWNSNDGVCTGHCKIPAADTSIAQLFLSYNDIAVHQWWITDPDKHLNPRHAIHQLFDRDLKILAELLFQPEADKASDFEFAVSNLLNLLGFAVTSYGRVKKLQDGPDIIAVTPSGHIGVVECTLGLLNHKSKLSKLVHRSNIVKEKMLSAGYGHFKIQPVIVTQLSKEAVSADLENAGKHGVAVICKEDLETLLKQIPLFPNPEKTFEDALRLIPGNNQGNLFSEREVYD